MNIFPPKGTGWILDSGRGRSTTSKDHRNIANREEATPTTTTTLRACAVREVPAVDAHAHTTDSFAPDKD